jgi:NAD(P)-dependent dehydrogenase (short-subunit alcohol dehydrogenase family)
MASNGTSEGHAVESHAGRVLSSSAASSIVNIGVLTNKVALITGASSGLGRAIAQAFAAAGAYIVSGDITEKPPVTPLLAETMKKRGDNLDMITPTVELINKNFPGEGGKQRATFVECNVLKEESIAKAVKTAVDVYGRLDIMVNNAGMLIWKHSRQQSLT